MTEGCQHRCQDKSKCKHVCCKMVGSNSSAIRSEDLVDKPESNERAVLSLLSRAKKARQSDRPRAVALLREGIDVYVDHRCYRELFDFSGVLWRQNNFYDATAIKQMRESASSSDQFHVARLLMTGRCGAAKNTKEAHRLFELAAAQRHAFALAFLGGILLKDDPGRAVACLRDSEELGCAIASNKLGQLAKKHEDYAGAVRHYLLGLGRHLQGCRGPLEALLSGRHTPYGTWTPYRHLLVEDDVHSEILSWMCLSKRLPFPRDLKLMVASYVCTDYLE